MARFAPYDDGHAAERLVDVVFADAISRGIVPPAPPAGEVRDPGQAGERVMTGQDQASEMSV